ncbi:hypothetical protein EV360DRAFT_74515 [Lentinula raphanica]|nr:hypothetical protein EV360DRAFT_74515 [Lentinula raphanica]
MSWSIKIPRLGPPGTQTLLENLLSLTSLTKPWYPCVVDSGRSWKAKLEERLMSAQDIIEIPLRHCLNDNTTSTELVLCSGAPRVKESLIEVWRNYLTPIFTGYNSLHAQLMPSDPGGSLPAIQTLPRSSILPEEDERVALWMDRHRVHQRPAMARIGSYEERYGQDTNGTVQRLQPQSRLQTTRSELSNAYAEWNPFLSQSGRPLWRTPNLGVGHGGDS